MSVLVLGPNGQLGSDLFRANASRKSPLNLVPIGRQELDVSQPEDVHEVLRRQEFETLINCTSYHKTDEVEKNASQAFAINSYAVKAMAEVCQQKHARFIHISTDYVFSGQTTKPYKESDCLAPINVYGASKAMGETLACLAHDRVYVLRAASLFGVAGASSKGGNFGETMLRVGKEKGELRVVNDITMSPTSTADVAAYILEIIGEEAEPGIYHAVNSGQATWYEFAKEIIHRGGINAEVTPITSDEFPTVAARPAYSVLDNKKMAAVVGDIPHWKEALDRYLHEKGHLAAA